MATTSLATKIISLVGRLSSLNLNWTSVLENILAGSFVAFLFGVFLKWLIDWRDREKLELIINLEDPPANIGNVNWFSVKISNLGKHGFIANDIVWHIYWPHIFSGGYFIDEKGQRLSVQQRSFKKVGESNIHGQRHSHIQRIVDINVAPGREINILYFKLHRTFSKNEIRIPYQFSTSSKGVIPKRVWKYFRFKKIEGKDHFPRLELFPFAKVRDIRNSEHRGTSFIPQEDMTSESF